MICEVDNQTINGFIEDLNDIESYVIMQEDSPHKQSILLSIKHNRNICLEIIEYPIIP